MRKIISTILLISLFCSCERILRPGSEGSGDIVIELNTALQTKADEARDGSKMNNLHIWLVSGSNIVDYLNWNVAYTDENTSYCQISAEDGGATAKALFTGVDKGQYTLYFVANLPSNLDISAYQKGGTIDSNFTDHILPAVENNEPPFPDASGMPLSLVKNIEVSAGTNRISAELVRSCARIRLTVRNNTVENTLVLKKIALSDGNPSVGYLFPRADFRKPSSADMGPFNSMELTKEGQTTDIVIPHGDTYTYIDQYMYETGPDGAVSLGFEIAGGLFEDGVKSPFAMTYDNSSPQTTIDTEAIYFIRSATNTSYYIYDNGGTLASTNIPDLKSIFEGTEWKKYAWKFTSASGTTKIQNVSTGNYLTLSTSTAAMGSTGTTLTMTGSGTTNFKFYIRNGNRYYYMSIGNSSVSVSNSRNTNNIAAVNLIPITFSLKDNNGNAAEKYFDKKVSSLHYIGKYGNPIPLEHIYRNQDVQIVVNVHYNPASGVLYFETSDWVDESNNTTFD